MDILSSILFALGFIGGIAAFTMAFALKSSQKALKISLLCGAICVIMVIVGYIIMPKYPSTDSYDDDYYDQFGGKKYYDSVYEYYDKNFNSNYRG